MSKKKRVLILVVLAIVIISAVLFFYKGIGVGNNTVLDLVKDKSAINPYTRWGITFNKELTADEAESIKVKLVSASGTTTEGGYFMTEGMKGLEVYAPEGGYKEGESYTLIIESAAPFDFQGQAYTKLEKQFSTKRGYEDLKIDIEDSNLEAVIRETINKPTGDIYTKDVEGITTLIANGRGIKNINGIEYLVNLRDVFLDVNEIENIAPLKGVLNLERVGLQQNNVENIDALEGKNLKYISLDGNDISNYDAVKNIYGQLEWKDFELK